VELLTESLTVRVDLSLGSVAEVHCGVFHDGYALLNVSAAAIRFQSWFNVSFIETTTMTITGLQEGTTYSLYCMTSTVGGGYDMSLANILNTCTVVDVPCVSSPTCGVSVVVDVLSKNVLISDYMQSVLTVGLVNSYMLQDDMVVVVDVTLFDPDGTHEAPDCASSSGVVVTPRVLSFYGGVEPSSSSPMEVHVGSLCPGPYQVAVSMHRVDEYTSSSALLNTSSSSLSGVSVEYSNGNLLYFFASDASFMTPQVVSAMFMGSANEVVITFDSSTDFAGGLVSRRFSCDALLSFPSSTSSRCFWRDSSNLIISMDSSSTLLPGDNITVIPGVIGASTVNVTTSMSMMAPVVVQVTVGEEVVPDITIAAPSEQAACAPFALDIMSSTGFVGRAWQNVSISVRSAMVLESGLTPVQENATELVVINEFFATTYDIDAATAVPAGYLKAGQLYVFDVELCNCLGSCGKASHRLWVTPVFTPFMSHRSDATRTMVRGDILTIPSGVLSFTCLTEEDAAVVSVTQVWTVVEATSVVTAFDPTPLLQVSSHEFQALVLPAYSFPSASLYEILEVVEVTVSDGVSNERRNSTFKNSVLVQVSKSPVHAALAPEGQMMIAVNDVKWLDASGSYDSNVAGVQSAGLHYQWDCMRMGPLSVDAPDKNCSGFLRVNASLHTMAMLSPDVGRADVGSEYRITLYAYSADMLYYYSIGDSY
jgi:hypothetical protein